jgi:type II secretory pathway pseudopilin PulG
MAALLVALSIMAIMMTVAMPVWKQNAQREKEEELIFRGKQWVHGIALFQRKYVGAYPPTLNVLVEQHMVRKKWKDPITADDFDPVAVGQGIVPGASGGQTGRAGQTTARGGQQPSTFATQPGGATPQGAPGGISNGPPVSAGRSNIAGGLTGGGMGIQGVVSKSKDESIRIYNGRTHYNEWQFVYQPPPQRGGATPGAVPGQTAPGQQQPGPPGQGPFGRGRGRGEGGNDGRGRGFGPGGRGFGPGGQQFPQPFPQPGQPGRGRG